ncbi:MAG: hypothetical protein ACR2IW_01645, partial [Candidatus Fonsibacter lacus]
MKKNKFSVVTTFNKTAYNLYANKMVNSFDVFWDSNIFLNIYLEDLEKPRDNFTRRINFFSFNDEIDGWYKFKEKFFLREVNKPDNGVNSFYKYSAIKFAHKVYTIKKQLEKNNSDYLQWLDSDVITIKNIHLNFLDGLINDRNYLSYLGRDHINFHSECGFLIFNIKHNLHNQFWVNMSEMYEQGMLFNEKEWHDSYIFDVVRLKLEKNGLQNFNISKLGLKKTNDTLNVFDN